MKKLLLCSAAVVMMSTPALADVVITTNPTTAQDSVNRAAQSVKQAAHDIKNAAVDSWNAAKNSINEQADKISDKAANAYDNTRANVHEAVNNVNNAANNAINSVAPKVQVVDHALAHYVTPADSDFVVSSIINSSVKNYDDEVIGTIKDVVVRQSNVEGIVIAVGGFLGVGERYVVVDPSSVHMNVVNGAWHIVVNASKDSLKSAPEFKYEGKWAR